MKLAHSLSGVLSVKVPAKINLSLRITGRRGNLHTLDMTAVSVDLYDEVALIPSDGTGRVLHAGSALTGFDENRFLSVLVIALQKYEAAFGPAGCDFEIKKNIPLGAGMGGSSAPIAGMMRVLAQYKHLEFDRDFLSSLGSDVPYMYTGGAARITGTGECVNFLPYTELHFVVAIPPEGVDSEAAYGLYDNIDIPSFERAAAFCGKNGGSVKLNGLGEVELENDLYFASSRLNGGIGIARDALLLAGAESVVMSGSGSAVAAVFGSRARAEAAAKKMNFDGDVYVLKSTERI